MNENKERGRWKGKPLGVRQNAEEHIRGLMLLAFERRNEEVSKRYVALALRIAQKYKVRIPREFRSRFCKKCHSVLVPGENLRVRLSKHKVVYTCLKCGRTQRFGYGREQKARRLRKL